MSASDLPFLQRLHLRENHIFLALTIIIAVLAGLAAVLFTLAIRGTSYLLFGIAPSYLRYILVPTCWQSSSRTLAAAAFHKPRLPIALIRGIFRSGLRLGNS